MTHHTDQPDVELSYQNDLGDTVSFRAVADEAVVSLDPADPDTADAADTADLASSLNASDAGSVRTVNPAAGFAIVRVAATDADALGVAAGPADSMPVLLDGEDNRRYFVPGQLTVQFADGVSDDEAQRVIGAAGSRVLTAQRTPGYYAISVPEDSDLFSTIRSFNERDDVAFAEPSEIGLDSLLGPDAAGTVMATSTDRSSLDAPPPERGADALDGREPAALLEPFDRAATDAEVVPSYPEFTRLWGLYNHGQSVEGVTGTNDADIDGTIAWNIHQGSPQVVVAVIDTGADLDHPDLRSQLLPRGTEDWDFAAADGSPDDSGSHGTHVAGTAVGNQNGSGVSGVAPRCRLMPLRVNLTSGMNQNRADAINYVAARARRDTGLRFVINCSWRTSGDHAGVRTAIRTAVRSNVVVVFAAGNSNRDIGRQPQYPAVYPEVIAVAATDQRDQRAGFSNYGAPVDVSAPGVNIWSSVPDDSHGFMDGTSMASPHVAGLAALIWSRNPSLSNAAVRRIIEGTVDDIDARNPGFAGALGTGRINAYRALSSTPAPQLQATLVRTLPFPQATNGSSTALTFIPGAWFPWRGLQPQLLFLTQQAGSERVYFLRPSTGAVVRSVDPQANDTIGAMAWDGSSIRVANVTTGAGRINTIDPSSGHQTGSIAAPAGRGEGMAWDRGSLYYSTVSHLHRIRPSDGRVLWSRPAPGGECRGMASGDGFLFAAHSSHGTISVFRPELPGLLHGTITLPGLGGRRAEGLAYDWQRNELFVADQGSQQIRVFRITL